jgi:heptaprenylglyceryl phosphate synthase
MGQIIKKNNYKYIFTYIATIMVIYLLNTLNIKFIQQLPLEYNEESTMMLSAIIWFIIISMIYILSYVILNKITNYRNNPFSYFLPYFVIIYY